MVAGFFRELKHQVMILNQVLRTREFWIYFAVILVLVGIAMAGVWMAVGFDPLTRAQLQMRLSCRTVEGQLATIIIGGFVFALSFLFTLGEVINWVEEKRMSRAPGRQPYDGSIWRPALHVLGTSVVGVGGLMLMRAWCT